MSRKRTNERIAGRYFTWLLGCRKGVWHADGRSNVPSVGRHSLGTRDADEARRLLAQLDLTMAVKHGKADAAALNPLATREVPMEEGQRLYLEHVSRARVVGGVRPSSQKRYRAVFKNFVEFARTEGLTCWNRVKARTLEAYAASLDAKGRAHRTEYLELNTIKQMIAWLIREQLLPASCRIVLPLEKPEGTDTYCWRKEEVCGMLDFCRQQPGLGWLAGIIVALTFTGLRIAELTGLRWSDIDLPEDMIRLVDESSAGRRPGKRAARTLKAGRGRSFPIHEELRPVLEAMTQHPDGYVFHGPKGGRLKPDTVRRILIREVLTPLAERFPTPEGEVGFVDGRLHSFRHFFCSLCANRGVPQQVVMRWLGHTSSDMVQLYYHLHDEEARRQMRRITLSDDASRPEGAGK
jgi:integrase